MNAFISVSDNFSAHRLTDISHFYEKSFTAPESTISDAIAITAFYLLFTLLFIILRRNGDDILGSDLASHKSCQQRIGIDAGRFPDTIRYLS